MSRAALETWLASRRPSAPAALAARILTVAREAPAEVADLPLPNALSAIGRGLVRQITARRPAGRDTALDLLAADAFITYAFEAQAELDIHGLNPLATEAWDE